MRGDTVTPEPTFTVLEMYVYLGAFLALMVAGFALAAWWQLRDRL
jgi:hypothetical protein